MYFHGSRSVSVSGPLDASRIAETVALIGDRSSAILRNIRGREIEHATSISGVKKRSADSAAVPHRMETLGRGVRQFLKQIGLHDDHGGRTERDTQFEREDGRRRPSEIAIALLSAADRLR